jgi:hypothetical protein
LKPILIWCEALKKLNRTVLGIHPDVNSSLAKKSDLKILLPEKARAGIPRRFYIRVAYVFSPLPEKLTERGFNLPKYISGLYRSITE